MKLQVRFYGFILWVVFVPLVLSSQSCKDSLDIYTFYYQGRTYEIVKELKSWQDAAACAVERGGYLVHIGSQEEQDSVFYAINYGASIPDNYVSVMDGGGVAYVWIGASDIVSEGSWIWDGDNDSTGVNWWNGQGAAGTGGGAAMGGAFYNWGGKSTGTVKEPDNYGNNQDGAAIGLRGWPGGTGALGIAGEWNDIALSNHLYFIIEYDVNPEVGELFRQEPGIRIFPQPAGEMVHIESAGEAINGIRVLGMDGKIIKDEAFSGSCRVTLSLNGLKAGFYLLTVVTGKNLYYARVLNVQ